MSTLLLVKQIYRSTLKYVLLYFLKRNHYRFKKNYLVVIVRNVREGFGGRRIGENKSDGHNVDWSIVFPKWKQIYLRMKKSRWGTMRHYRLFSSSMKTKKSVQNKSAFKSSKWKIMHTCIGTTATAAAAEALRIAFLKKDSTNKNRRWRRHRYTMRFRQRR